MQNPKYISHQVEPLLLDVSSLPNARHLSREYVLYLASTLARHFSNQANPQPALTGSKFIVNTHVYGITVESSIESAIYKRLSCKKFWRRALEKKANEERLNHEAKNAIIGGKEKEGKAPLQNYCSDDTLIREQNKRKDNDEKLSRYKVVNTITNKEESLLKIAQANEKNRISELYFMVKSLEKLAMERGFKWLFITLTAPSKFHPNPLKGRRSYDPDVGIRGSHDYLKRQWVQIRSILNERGISAGPEHYFGFRTVEPHKDGSLHWHLLVFVNINSLDSLSTAIREKFPEKTAATIVHGKVGSGSASAATYLYKYITKGISKEKTNYKSNSERTMDNEREKRDLASLRNKDRVQAALKALGIRQYQPFGVYGLNTIFKKINKLNLQNVSAPHGSILQYVRDNIWRNTDGYLNMLKNAELFTSNAQIKLIKEETQSSYGEPKKKVIGIRIGGTDFLNDSTYKIVRA
ncbi:hypothetical protein DKY63_29185 [Pseudomonas putida]|uniref:Replication gene A protein-like domain-containing protein n=1 Tax=Pseudomonas putida TaxID=303 RepID=A0A2Z4RRJ2_PSEPU|nr:replication endonuclease [Pseudomonas putida]AWY43773.1 hypothetical protein DKY63_29185 [Pseudomonas putida]